MGGAASPVQSTAGSGIGKLALLKALPWVAVSLGVGSIGGIGGFVAGHRVAGSRANHASVLNQRETAPRAGPAPAPLAVPLAPPLEPPRPATTTPTVLPAAAPHVRRTQTARSDDHLAEEEALLRQAESALRAGSWSTALAEIDAYAQRYPRGQLAEEAAYLGVRACQRGGDATGTRARLLDFRRRFPSSPLGKSAGD
jgi:TolA-binding protein